MSDSDNVALAIDDLLLAERSVRRYYLEYMSRMSPDEDVDDIKAVVDIMSKDARSKQVYMGLFLQQLNHHRSNE